MIQIASVVGLFYVFALPFQLSRLPNRPKDYSAPLLTGRLAMTRAELMRHALTQALRRVHIGPKKLKLDEEPRWQIAGEAEELRRSIKETWAYSRNLILRARLLLG